MKRTTLFLIILLIINYSSPSNKILAAESFLAQPDSIRIFSSQDLYNISAKWAEEYNKLFPETKIKVIPVADDKISDNLFKNGEIGFISDEYSSGFNGETTRKLVVGRDVIVPVINSKNPFLEEIRQKGVSPEKLLAFLSNSEARIWGTLLGGEKNSNANFYYLDNQIITKGIKEFLGNNEMQIVGIKAENSLEMLSAIQKDPYAIGFCQMINILDPEKQTIAENISLLPIDRNGNGIMDYNEKIYDDYAVFSRGVWIGKYPKALYTNIYSISPEQPKNEKGTAFLKWVINDGQQFLYGSGYSDLLISERQTIIGKLYEAQVYAASGTNSKPLLGTFLIIVIGLVIAGLSLDFLFRYVKRNKSKPAVNNNNIQSVLDTNGMDVPRGLYFDKTHTWAFMEQNGLVKVGIDDFLQHITGTITRIKMKDEGEEVKKGDPILTIIQNGKQLNLYAPISGIIKEKNNVLNTKASILNSSPYNEGWVYRIEPSNWHRENQLLFMSGRHREFIKNEFSRLKDFLAASLVADEEIYARVILQDGGELVDNTLSNLGPEVWDDFQSKFIDPSRQIWFHELF